MQPLSRPTHHPLYPFPDSINISPRPCAIAYANHLSSLRPVGCPRHLTLWTDASISPFARSREGARLIVSAVGHLRLPDALSSNLNPDPTPSSTTRVRRKSKKSRWCLHATRHALPPGVKASFEAGVIAIYEGFWVAVNAREYVDTVTIMTDCESFLKHLRKGPSGEAFDLSTPRWICGILESANMLFDEGIMVELHWVPAHAKVGANESVDRFARRVRVRADEELFRWALNEGGKGELGRGAKRWVAGKERRKRKKEESVRRNWYEGLKAKMRSARSVGERDEVMRDLGWTC